MYLACVSLSLPTFLKNLYEFPHLKRFKSYYRRKERQVGGEEEKGEEVDIEKRERDLKERKRRRRGENNEGEG